MIIEVHADRLEFLVSGRRVTIPLFESAAPGPLWMTEFRLAADLIKRGLVKIGALGLNPLNPSVSFVLRDRSVPIGDLERRALESAALIAGARNITVEM